jgi:hypothetical protein
MNPAPDVRLSADAELLLICTSEGEQRFVNRYGGGLDTNGGTRGESIAS